MRLRGGGGRYGYHLIRDLLAVLIVFVLPNYDTGDKGHAANSSTCRGFSEQPALLNYMYTINILCIRELAKIKDGIRAIQYTYIRAEWSDVRANGKIMLLHCTCSVDISE